MPATWCGLAAAGEERRRLRSVATDDPRWGTLGVITEVTVQLRARPEVDRTLVVAIPPPTTHPRVPRGAAARDARSRRSPLELCSATLVPSVGVGDCARVPRAARGELAARRARNRPRSRSSATRRARAGGVGPASRRRAARGGAVIRLGTTQPRSGGCGVLRRPLDGAGWWLRECHARARRGAMRRPRDDDRGEERPAAGYHGGAAVGGIAHRRAAARVALDRTLPLAVADPLSVEIRRAFDPDHLLNPGILGGSA